jgi:hypothetical protein
VTAVPGPKLAWQPERQLIPPGVELTWPEPVPCFETVRRNEFGAKVAVTERPWPMVSWQLPVPEQSPDQPANTEPASGVAASVTTVPASKFAVQPEQVVPAGLRLTFPEPVPAVDTVRGNGPSEYHCFVGASHQAPDG